MKKKESFVQIVVRDEGVRRACAELVVALVGAITNMYSGTTTPED